MKNKTVLMIGVVGILLVFGAAVALAQNTGSGKTKDAENHECTPEMMENMSENCPEQMMQTGACENMMNGANGCGGMMAAENTEAAVEDHCKDMDSGMDSMMGSSDAVMKTMM